MGLIDSAVTIQGRRATPVWRRAFAAAVLCGLAVACSSPAKPGPPGSEQRVYGHGNWYISVPDRVVEPGRPVGLWVMGRDTGDVTLQIADGESVVDDVAITVPDHGRGKWALIPTDPGDFEPGRRHRIRLLDSDGNVLADAELEVGP